jgi:hypothetical protein
MPADEYDELTRRVDELADTWDYLTSLSWRCR